MSTLRLHLVKVQQHVALLRYNTFSPNNLEVSKKSYEHISVTSVTPKHLQNSFFKNGFGVG